MATLSKPNLIDAVASRTGVTKADAARNIDALLEVITEAVANGDEVKMTGFINIKVEERAARQGRNPRTGETINIPAKNAVKIKAGSVLKDAAEGSEGN